jgi:hypothetical protein
MQAKNLRAANRQRQETDIYHYDMTKQYEKNNSSHTVYIAEIVQP